MRLKGKEIEYVRGGKIYSQPVKVRFDSFYRNSTEVYAEAKVIRSAQGDIEIYVIDLRKLKHGISLWYEVNHPIPISHALSLPHIDEDKRFLVIAKKHWWEFR
jgi:hypothetical protein